MSLALSAFDAFRSSAVVVASHSQSRRRVWILSVDTRPPSPRAVGLDRVVATRALDPLVLAIADVGARRARSTRSFSLSSRRRTTETRSPTSSHEQLSGAAARHRYARTRDVPRSTSIPRLRRSGSVVMTLLSNDTGTSGFVQFFGGSRDRPRHLRRRGRSRPYAAAMRSSGVHVSLPVPVIVTQSCRPSPTSSSRPSPSPPCTSGLVIAAESSLLPSHSRPALGTKFLAILALLFLVILALAAAGAPLAAVLALAISWEPALARLCSANLFETGTRRTTVLVSSSTSLVAPGDVAQPSRRECSSTSPRTRGLAVTIVFSASLSSRRSSPSSLRHAGAACCLGRGGRSSSPPLRTVRARRVARRLRGARDYGTQLGRA